MYAVGLKKNENGIFHFDIEKPQIQKDDEVLIKILETGIDGTDAALFKHNIVDAAEDKNFLVLGHETVGQIAAVGKKVTKFKPGDIVVPTVRRGCGICTSCLNGKSDYCFTGLYKEHGIHKLHGYLTEFTVAPESYVVTVPTVARPYAVWSEPMSIIEKSFEQMQIVQSRLPSACPHRDHDWSDADWGTCKTAIVVGAGPLGFLATAYLRLYGVDVYVLEIVPEDHTKIEMIRRLGAHYLDANAFPPAKIAEALDRIDIIFEASGASQIALDLISIMSRNSVYIMTGIPQKVRHQVCTDGNTILRTVVRQNIVIIGSVNGNVHHFNAALKNMQKIQEKFNGILFDAITHRFKLADYEKAFNLDDPTQLKIVFEIGN